MITISIIQKSQCQVNKDAEIEEIVLKSLSKLGETKDLEVEIIFVGKNEIKELNKKYREIDKATDVLSFPQTLFKSNQVNILGTIVISPEIAEERDEPINELIKHGILHLCGYDHESDVEKWDRAAEKINCNF